MEGNWGGERRWAGCSGRGGGGAEKKSTETAVCAVTACSSLECFHECNSGRHDEVVDPNLKSHGAVCKYHIATFAGKQMCSACVASLDFQGAPQRPSDFRMVQQTIHCAARRCKFPAPTCIPKVDHDYQWLLSAYREVLFLKLCSTRPACENLIVDIEDIGADVFIAILGQNLTQLSGDIGCTWYVERWLTAAQANNKDRSEVRAFQKYNDVLTNTWDDLHPTLKRVSGSTPSGASAASGSLNQKKTPL